MATSPTLPASTKPYGSTTFLDPTGLLWFGTVALEFTSVYSKDAVDSLIAGIGGNLQSVTNGAGNNQTTNALQVTGLDNIDLTQDGLAMFYQPGGSTITNITGSTITSTLSLTTGEASLGFPGLRFKVLNEETPENSLAFLDGRLTLLEAINPNEAVTLGQVNALIPSVPSLQSVSEVGASTDRALLLTGATGFTGATGLNMYVSTGIAAFVNRTGGETKGDIQFNSEEAGEIKINSNYIYEPGAAIAAKFNGRVEGTPAALGSEFITLDQLTASLGSFVPYIGATSNVNLGSHSLLFQNIDPGNGTYNNTVSPSEINLTYTPEGGANSAQAALSAEAGLYLKTRTDIATGQASLRSDLLTVNRNFQFPNADGTLALTSNLSSYVPYTGATGNVNLGSNNITSNSFIKSGGTSSQFLKADGSVDGNTYQNTSQKNQANGYAGLDSGVKIFLSQLPDSILGALIYQGTWNATTNSPTLANPPSSDTKGHYYVTNTAGTQFGITFAVGDWIVSNGTEWQKVDNSDAVTTVFGRLGNVVANESDYSSFYPLLNGTGATGTWGINISGNAATATNATNWGISGGYLNADFTTLNNTAPNYVLGSTSGTAGGYSATALRSFISGATLNNDISGNAITWNSQTYTPVQSGAISIMMAHDGTGWKYTDAPAVKTFLSLPSSGGYDLQSVTDRGSITTNPITINSGTATGVNFQRSSAAIGQIDFSGNDLNISATNDLLFQPSGGNVGIGTTSPSAKLDVNGDASFRPGTNRNIKFRQLGMNLAISAVNDSDVGIPFGIYTSGLTVNTPLTDFTGSVSVTNAPVNPTDVVRLTDLANYVNTTGSQIGIAGNKQWLGDQVISTPGSGFYAENGTGGTAFMVSAVFQSVPGGTSPKNFTASFDLGIILNTGTTSGGDATLRADNLTTGRTFQFPNAAGTLALVPDVSVTSTSLYTIPTTNSSYNTFSGTTSTWTLPTIASNSGKRVVIINRGSGNITLNSNAGGSDIDESGVYSASIVVPPAATLVLVNNSLKWVIVN